MSIDVDQVQELHADDEPFYGPIDSEATARILLLEYQRCQKKADRVQEVRDQIAADYDRRVEKIQQRQDEIRQQLSLYVESHGSVGFPDAGSAYLSKRKAKITIADREAAQAWAREQGETFTRELFDEPAFRAWALVMLDSTGEIPPGCEFVPESKGLTIKGAS